MLYAKTRELIRSLSLRLTLWHAAMLLLALGICYAVSYVLVSSLVLTRADAYLKIEADECTRIFAIQQLSGVMAEARQEAESEGIKDVYFRVTDPAGKVLFETDAGTWPGLNIDPAVVSQAATTRTPKLLTLTRQSKKPEVRAIVLPLSPEMTLTVAASTHDDIQFVHDTMRLMLVMMLGAWLAAVIVGFFLSQRALGRIHAVRDAATDFAGGSTSRRVESSARGDEVDLLAQSFNSMADRIEGLLGNLRQTNDSLAHELRSPITNIRGRCELALTSDATPDSHAILANTIERCDHMLSIINTVLELSETDAGMIHLAKNRVDLCALLTEASDIFGPMAEDAQVTLTCDFKGPAFVLGDTAKLQRLFSNLLDNAVKFSPPNGSVTISLELNATDVLVSILDTGPGIEPQEREEIFERFFRGAASDGRPGNGLGLTLARTIARSHGGDIFVRDHAISAANGAQANGGGANGDGSNMPGGQPGPGAEFVVRLPLITDIIKK